MDIEITDEEYNQIYGDLIKELTKQKLKENGNKN